MSKRLLAYLSGQRTSSLLLRDAHALNWPTGTGAIGGYLSTLSVDQKCVANASSPSLPPCLRELQESVRAPRSSIISAIDKRLHNEIGTASSADDTVEEILDNGASRLLLRSNSVTRANVDTLRLLRRYNGGVSGLRGQTILAKVLNVEGKRVLVDTGFTGLSEVPRNDVTIAHIYTEDGQLPARLSTGDIRPGDMLRLRIDCMYTPYGDMQLSAVKGDAEQQRRVMWTELQQRMEQQRLVSGRVLNDCPGGFAVGIGGFIAFLPAALATTTTSRLVGVRQDFQVIAMDNTRQRITVRDPRLQHLRR